MADAHGSGPCPGNGVGVQLPPRPLWLRQTTKAPPASTAAGPLPLVCPATGPGALRAEGSPPEEAATERLRLSATARHAISACSGSADNVPCLAEDAHLQDHTVPEVITKSTRKQYRHSTAETDLLEFEDRGHSLTIDSGWREVADGCLTWLKEHNL